MTKKIIRQFLLALLVLLVWTPVAVRAQITVPTGLLSGQTVWLDFQFTALDPDSPFTDATLSGFTTNGVLGNSVLREITVTGMLPGALTFGNDLLFNGYLQNIMLDTTLGFTLTTANRVGTLPGVLFGSEFTLRLLKADQSGYHPTAGPDNLLVRVTVAPDGAIVDTQVYPLLATVTISGTVPLEECVNRAQPITFEFRPLDGTATFHRTVTLSSTGDFALTGVPNKAYEVRVKGQKWLARILNLDASGGDVAGLSISLTGGDANGDNSADALDLAMLITAFNTVSGDAGYDPLVDFNCDDSADALDLAILITNFNTEGDS